MNMIEANGGDRRLVSLLSLSFEGTSSVKSDVGGMSQVTGRPSIINHREYSILSTFIVQSYRICRSYRVTMTRLRM
jgi:hypothetical protein